MYRAYESDLFRFDQLYRHFCEAADLAESSGLGHPQAAAGRHGGVLRQLVSCPSWPWPGASSSSRRGDRPAGEVADRAGCRTSTTSTTGNVRPRLDEADNRRAFVIISDAFRYEAAQELAQELNGKYRFEATLTSQLGVLPSYTALGMASLLPHKTLAYKPNGDVLVDGKPTSSTEQRDEILEAVGGMACKADDLLAMKKDEGREFVKDRRVVYIYHNTVDAVGDVGLDRGEDLRGGAEGDRRTGGAGRATSSTT